MTARPAVTLLAALLEALVGGLNHLLDRVAVAAVLWFCGSPDQPWSAEA